MVTFSNKLQKLLSSKQPITLQILIDNFAEKSFAILFLLLLAMSALPLPTGGVTHILEIIAMLLALELIIGRNTVWLPRRWLYKELPKSLQTSALPRFVKMVSWVEKFSHPRLMRVQVSKLYGRIIGLVVLIFAAFAFLAPPFSGLDTLPSIGVVLVSLGLMFEDSLLSVIGIITGSIGIGLIILLGKLAFSLL